MSVEARARLASGEPAINFRAHEVRAGTAGARDEFEEMIAMLVRALYLGARMIEANPGDWGIDVLVGDLSGTVVIWQAKYFMPVVTESHQKEIRESFAAAIKAGREHGHKIRQWTLCVPSSLDAKTDKWWSSWKQRTQRETGVKIDLWHEVELKTRLISPDAANVRRHYYDPYNPASAAAADRAPVYRVNAETAEELETTLFVRQLREAGHREVGAAKLQFFNAELLAREVVDKAVPSEVSALTEADASVHGIWESHFNDACIRHASTPSLPGLHTEVMREIRTTAGSPAWPLQRAGAVHGCGLMHRVVEDGRAGWTVHWEDIATTHRAASPNLEGAEAGSSTTQPNLTGDNHGA